MTSTAESKTITSVTVMKCHDCNMPFSNNKFGDLTDDTDVENIGSFRKDGKKKSCWWWCRDCMATLCRRFEEVPSRLQ
ncbi:unnamed protein product [Thelazia callipaeda]|uniref:Conserved domain protein n=1 Tax=Thelazia callipaeda TaxID=103827 RepID=A0A0N5D827_THECL|nr:unnamed protein product [Thelazia callipaeda]